MFRMEATFVISIVVMVTFSLNVSIMMCLLTSEACYRYLLCGLSVTEESADTVSRAGAAISTPSPSKSSSVKREKMSGSQAIQVGQRRSWP